MSPNIESPSVICPTGNCTWPIIPTIGVCGACVNLTNDIKYDRSPSSYCTVTIGDLHLTGVCDSDTPDFTSSFTVGRGSGKIFESLNSNRIQADSPNLIADFSALGVPASKILSSGLNGATAAECALWYCLQAHDVRVRRGELQDTVVMSWGETLNRNPGSTNGNITFINIPDEINIESSEMYGISGSQMLGMSEYANATFVGNVSVDGLLGVIAPSTDFAGGMQRSFDNMDAWIQRLAKSMTNDVRLNSTTGADNVRYSGTAFATQVIIVVRWAWIAYPAILVILSVANLIFEIAHTSKLNVRPWKSDSLLPIYMQLESELKSLAAEGINKPDGIRERVGKYRVQLTTEGERFLEFAREKKTEPDSYVLSPLLHNQQAVAGADIEERRSN
jgi:hypothetical protein